jgi:hypothetical protein
MRMVNSTLGTVAGTSNNSGYSPATLAAGSPVGQDPAVAGPSRNKAFMKEAADNGYLPELLKAKWGNLN